MLMLEYLPPTYWDITHRTGRVKKERARTCLLMSPSPHCQAAPLPRGGHRDGRMGGWRSPRGPSSMPEGATGTEGTVTLKLPCSDAYFWCLPTRCKCIPRMHSFLGWQASPSPSRPRCCQAARKEENTAPWGVTASLRVTQQRQGEAPARGDLCVGRAPRLASEVLHKGSRSAGGETITEGAIFISRRGSPTPRTLVRATPWLAHVATPRAGCRTIAVAPALHPNPLTHILSANIRDRVVPPPPG